MRELNYFLLLVAMMAFQVFARSTNVDTYNLFSADVYNELRKTEKGNFAVSPISAQIVTALAYVGSQGETAQQLATALHLPNDKQKVKDVFAELTSDLQGNGQYELSSANKIYVKDGFKFKRSFEDVARESFKAEVGTINFVKDGAAEEINKWVEGKTDDKIKDLVSKNDFDPLIRSLFVNALFFKGVWECPFYRGATYKKQFYINSKTQKETDMMRADEDYNYYESPDLNAKFLELSFEGDEVSMTFVLPNNKDGLSSLEETIRDVFVAPKYGKWQQTVHVEIPKFKIETLIQFNNIFEKLGVNKAFTDHAEIIDIVENEHLKIDKIAQKTYLEVHETGVTAAAATELLWSTRSLPTYDFVADHPFLYYIKVKDVVIFAGRYTSP